MSPQTVAYLMAGGATVMWGLVVIPIKRARTSGRLGIAISMAIGTIAMFALSGRDIAILARLSYPELGLYAVTGVLQFPLGCTLYYRAVQHGSLSVAVPITRVKTIIILFLSIALGLEVFRWGLLAAALMALFGGIMVGAPTSAADGDERVSHWTAVGYAVGACVFWAIGETFMGLLPHRVPAMASNGMLLGCGLVAWSVYALVSGAWRELLAMPGHDIWCFLAHGLLSFATGYALFVAAIQIAGPPRVVIITSTYPLIAALVGWIGYGERFSVPLLIGAILLIGGVITLQFV
ncbi:MAG: DMT family transporter [Armatimonadota bacterium]|nr:DMT family transporter [Armatimonadota bacterium]